MISSSNVGCNQIFCFRLQSGRTTSLGRVLLHLSEKNTNSHTSAIILQHLIDLCQAVPALTRCTSLLVCFVQIRSVVSNTRTLASCSPSLQLLVSLSLPSTSTLLFYPTPLRGRHPVLTSAPPEMCRLLKSFQQAISGRVPAV